MTTAAGGPEIFEMMRRAVGLHQGGRIDDAAALYRTVLARQPNHADALYFLGMVAAQRSQFTEAEQLIGRALTLNPRNADACSNYAGVLNALKRPQEALASLERAVAIDPRMHAAHANRGITLHTLRRYHEAVAAYDRALALMPHDAAVLTYRGGALLALGRHRDALTSFDQALAANPGFQPAMTYRGNALGMLQRNEEALASYDRALALNARDAVALANRGNVLSGLNRHVEAIDSYDRALAIKPDESTALTNRGNPLTALGRYDEAIASYDRALTLQPDNAEAHYNRGAALQAVGRGEEAAVSYQAALDHRPRYPEALFGLCMTQLPAVYRSVAEIATCRSAYAGHLETLCGLIDRLSPAELAAGVGANQPFYLAYQGENDRDLQARYGSFICAVMRQTYPPPALPAAPAAGERVRVGLVSGFFNDHTIWKLMIRGWLGQLDRSRFQLFGYSTANGPSAETCWATERCDRLTTGPLSIDGWRAAIQADAPHVLIYPEIGMDKIAVQLAAQRLAPVQCAAWGHPETSGCPTIDYFLTSDLMEPPAAEAHYTETLVRLPNLSIYYEPFEPEPLGTSRADLGLRPDATVYWSSQSLYKYLPHYDAVFPRIAQELADAQFVFIEFYRGGHGTRIFRDRLDQAFAAAGLRAEDHCVFLPRMNPQQFVAAAGLCDVVLDTIGWSGGNTTLESFIHNLPVVTMDGPLMRARHSHAFLTMIDAPETIVQTVDDYVATAVRLGREPAWRAALGRKIAANRHRLYRDRKTIAALEDFLIRAVHHPQPSG